MNAIEVASIPVIISGRSIGNDNTGKSEPLADALAIIADIIVEADARPKAPKNIVIMKADMLLTSAAGANSKNKQQATALSKHDKSTLKISFPKKTSNG